MADNGRATIERLATEVLPTLIQRLAASELGELEVRENGWRIRLRRPTPDAAADSPSDSRRPAATSGAAQAGERTQATRAEREPVRGVVFAPAVGYFVSRDGIGVGTQVQAGDVLGHVDVLGVRQEVVAPVAGVLRALDVEAGQAVEFGQPIARVEVAPRAEAIRVEPELEESLVGSGSGDVQ